MSRPTKKSTKKKTTESRATEKFIYQVDGSVFFCERCTRMHADGIAPEPAPLGYLPVYIPTPPVPEPFVLKLKDKKTVAATKWKFKWILVCLPCAKHILPALRVEDISP